HASALSRPGTGPDEAAAWPAGELEGFVSRGGVSATSSVDRGGHGPSWPRAHIGAILVKLFAGHRRVNRRSFVGPPGRLPYGIQNKNPEAWLRAPMETLCPTSYDN